MSPSFTNHISWLRKTSDCAKSVLGNVPDEDDISRSVLVLAWSSLHERLQDKDMDDETFNKLIANIQKLYGSTNQRRANDLRLREIKKKSDTPKDEPDKDTPKGISPETRAHIESELGLL